MSCSLVLIKTIALLLCYDRWTWISDDNRFKNKPLFLWIREGANRSLFSSDAVSDQVPMILLRCSVTEFEEKTSGWKTFGFFSIKEALNLRISSVSHRSFHLSKEHNYSFRLLWQPLRRYISTSHNLFIKEVTNKKTGCTHVNWKWKGFIALFPLDLFLILWYFRPLREVNFEINVTQANLFIGGRFCHKFHGYSNKNFHFPQFNIP